MKLLSIEAAGSPASVALSIGNDVTERVCDDPRAQAEHLLGLIKSLLEGHNIALSDLDGLAVGRGPGSFTGLRVAAALAQGLAYSVHKPVANVSSLAAMAHRVFAEKRPISASRNPDHSIGQLPNSGNGERSGSPVDLTENTLLVCLDARKSQVYCALYEADELDRPRLVSPEAVLDPSEVVAQFKGQATLGTGNGFAEYPELAALDLDVVEDINPSATAIALRAASGVVSFEEPFLAVPEYVRNNVTHGS